LLNIVTPDVLLLGQKDFQQCMVIRQLLRITGREALSLIISPTVREWDGLAMSSRNLRLNKAQRSKAPALYEAMQKAKEQLQHKGSEQVKSEAVQLLMAQGFRIDYFEIVDAATLLPATDKTQTQVILVAAYLDDIRLIDNLPLN
jgi:pantoate--beta-alanine ligase